MALLRLRINVDRESNEVAGQRATRWRLGTCGVDDNLHRVSGITIQPVSSDELPGVHVDPLALAPIAVRLSIRDKRRQQHAYRRQNERRQPDRAHRSFLRAWCHG